MRGRGRGRYEAARVNQGASAPVVDTGTASVPTITGSAAEGQLLTAHFLNDDPDGVGTGITYQWKRGNTNISGATSSTYTAVVADVGSTLKVAVSYTDSKGFPATVTSAATGTVSATDSGDASVPTITGTAAEGSTLTAHFADNDPDGAATGVTYQWKRDNSNISGATSTTYVVLAADVGHTIKVTVAYTDGQGFMESLTSASTATVTAVDSGDASTPTINGTAREGQVLTAVFTDNDPDGAASGITYQWKRAGSNISGATASTYTLVTADVGNAITVTVSYTDGQGFSEALTSAATATVAAVVPLSLETGAASNTFSTTASGTVTLTTANAHDVIVVCVHCEKNSARQTVTSVTDVAGLTWARRSQKQWDGAGTIQNNFEVWWAHAPAALTADVITVTLSAATDDATILAFGVTGADTSSPWDSDASLPAFANFTTSPSPATISGVSTTAANTMLLALSSEPSTSTNTEPAGFTLIKVFTNGGGSNFSHQHAAEKIVSAAQSGITVAFGSNMTAWGLLVDAIKRG